ncbi:unnamed protein product [Closterium sp. Naga37s-1]|nr:unnamed protein product [Closterium sp. Naga37s-1]
MEHRHQEVNTFATTLVIRLVSSPARDSSGSSTSSASERGGAIHRGLAWHPHVCAMRDSCALETLTVLLKVGATIEVNRMNRSYSSSQPVLPPASVLTKGTQRETRGNFTTAPVTLFVYEAGQGLSGCGLQLAFHANFTFSLSPQSGRVGFNGFAFVVSATDRVGRGTGVGYGGMDKRSVVVEFDTRQDKQHGDMRSQHVGLNIQGEDKSLAAVPSPFPLSSKKAYTAWVNYEPGDPGTIQVFLADSKEKPREAVLERRLALCEVLEGGSEQHSFFFGFVASTTVKSFQKHAILESTVDTRAARCFPRPAARCFPRSYAGDGGKCGRRGKGATDLQTQSFRKHAGTAKHKLAMARQTALQECGARQPQIDQHRATMDGEQSRVVALLDSLLFISRSDAPMGMWVKLVRYLAEKGVPGFPKKGYGTYYTT